MKKKIMALLMAVTVIASLTACGAKDNGTTTEPNVTDEGTQTAEGETPATDDTEEAGEGTEPVEFSVGMVTDTGGVNDQSFNQSAWEGLQNFKEATGADISFLESTQETDYAPNLDKQVDEGKNLI